MMYQSLSWSVAGTEAASPSETNASAAETAPYVLRLIGGWQLTSRCGLVHIPLSAQRLVGFLALSAATSRTYVAGTLWPEVPEDRAHASLRSALWRISQVCPGIVATDGAMLSLADDVVVDVRELKGKFQALFWRRPSELSVGFWANWAGGELLPGWNSEWLLLEREWLRQTQIQAMEAISRCLAAERQFDLALQVATAALRIAPGRESTHRQIIRIHLMRGDVRAARRQFEQCAQFLLSESGLRPSVQMTDLVQPVLDAVPLVSRLT